MSFISEGGTIFELWPSEPVETAVDLGQLVAISLNSNQVAGGDDVLPDATGDPVVRGGWFADKFTPDGDEFGCKLWLYSRSSLTESVESEVLDAVLQGLQWMIDQQLCSTIDVGLQKDGRERLNLVVIVNKGTETEERFNFLWSDINGT